MAISRLGAARTPALQGDRLYHVLEAEQFSRAALEALFARAGELRANPAVAADRLQGRLLAALFYEPSTRTRLSFEAAMQRLGGRVMGTDNAKEFSSAAKGETLEDTIRIVSGYADVIVLRHPEEGAAKRAAAVADVPLVNGGDGRGEHPTQALLDLFTIQEELHRVDGVRVAMVGDLANGRTVRSLAALLTRFRGIEIVFVAPPQVAVREDTKRYLDAHGVRWSENGDLRAVLPDVDVVYQTRIQKERFDDPAEYESVKGIYVIDPDAMSRLRRDAIVMHPLPRVDEIDPAVDDDPRAAYFRQARNGMHIRMALLEQVLA